MEPPPGATVYLKSQLEPAEESIKMTQSVPEQPLVTRLQDSFSQKVNDEKVRLVLGRYTKRVSFQSNANKIGKIQATVTS